MRGFSDIIDVLLKALDVRAKEDAEMLNKINTFDELDESNNNDNNETSQTDDISEISFEKVKNRKGANTKGKDQIARRSSSGTRTNMPVMSISKEALFSIRTKEGKTAISLAASYGQGKAVSKLLQHGAKVPYSADFGWTAARVLWLKMRSSLGVGQRVAER
jgi:ankyrin repeat protein